MEKSTVAKFVSESIEDIRSGLPEGFRINDKIDFEVSVITTEGADGKIDVKLASIGSNVASQNIQKIRFSVIDEKSQAKNMKQAKELLMRFMTGFAQLDTRMQEISYNSKPKHKAKH